MSENKEQFEMQFDLNTIRHLGVKMYAQVPGALAELIANAYDADATEVKVKLYDKAEKRIVVEDNGTGMTAEEVNKNYLVIGRDRRAEEGEDYKTKKGRTPSGKKGLGKLALFGIGRKIKVETQSSGKEVIAFVMDWEEIKSQGNNRVYNPNPVSSGKIEGGCGTVVTISELRRKSPFNQNDLANRIARLFNYRTGEMKISVSVNDAPCTLVTPDMFFEGLKNIQMDKNDFNPFAYEEEEQQIIGRIVTTEKPLEVDVRGVALYANGRMVNLPEFFGDSVSGHFYSYTAGYLVVDFVDEGHGDDDLISTNRQSINWEDPRMDALKGHLRRIVLGMVEEWRGKRREAAEERVKKAIGKNASFNDLRPRIKKGVVEIVDKTPQLDDPETFVADFLNHVGPPKSDKKIMISHTSDDKDFANVIYQALQDRGVKPEHILYTSSDKDASRLPVDQDIYEYIRKFFVQHFYKNAHVIFVVSESMEKSWNAVLEAGAAWVTNDKADWRLATVNGHQPKPPLNRENLLYIAFTKEDGHVKYVDDVDARRILDYVVEQYNQRMAQMPAD